MVLEAIATILGGLTGILGTVATSITNYKSQKLKNELDIKMAELEIRKLEARTTAAIKLTEARISGEVELADTQAFIKSQEYGNSSIFSSEWVEKLLSATGWCKWVSIPAGVFIVILFGLVDLLKALMRPGLTLYLLIASTWVTYLAYDILVIAGIAKLTTTQAVEIFNLVIVTIIYLTVSCVTWWFGDRRIAKFIMRLGDDNYKPVMYDMENVTPSSTKMNIPKKDAVFIK
jgi:hypothetical protein